MSGGSATALVVGGVVAATLVAGCGPVNAGPGAADEYESWVLDVEGVESADVHGLSSLPFYAEVSAEVTLEDSLSEPEVVAALEELDTFSFADSNSASLSVDVVYVSRGVEITLAGQVDAEGWAAFVTDPSVRATASRVTVDAGPGQDDGEVSIAAVTRGDPVVGTEVLDAALERHLAVGVVRHDVLDDAGTTSVEGYETGPAREVYAQIVKHFPIVGARVREGEVVVSLSVLAPLVRADVVKAIVARSTADVVVSVAEETPV